MYYIQAKPRINSRGFSKTIAKFETSQEVLDYLKDNNIKALEKPCIFSHIILDNGQIIQQNISVGDREIPTSPQKLADLLNL